MRSIARWSSGLALAGLLLVQSTCGKGAGDGLLSLRISADPENPPASASKLVLTDSTGGISRTYSEPVSIAPGIPVLFQFPALPASDSPITFSVATYSADGCPVGRNAQPITVTIKAGAETGPIDVTLVSAGPCPDAGAPDALAGGGTGGSSTTSSGGLGGAGGVTVPVGGAGGNSSGGQTTAPGGSGGKATGGLTAGAGAGSHAGSGGTIPTGGSGASPGGTVATGGSSASPGGTVATGGSASGSGGATGGTPSTDPMRSPGCSATPTTTSACTSTTAQPCTIDVDGTKREYYLNLPSGYDGKKPVPVVWEYHPMGGNARTGMTLYQLNSKLTNVIFVSPQGLGSTAGFPNTNGQDEKMTRAINAEIEAKYCIDKTRYFATGFSYGGAMAYTAACNMSDVFRAVGAQSGSIVSGATCAKKQPARMVAVWATHGEADNTLAISGATPIIQALAKYNGCSTTTAPVNPSPCVAYEGCQQGYPVIWCVRPNDGHSMPSMAPAAIAEFFQQFL